MISVIVPVQTEPRETAASVCASVAEWAPPEDAEILIAPDETGCRGAALARAAARSRGEILFFVHADSRPPAGALGLILRTVAAGAAAGAFSLGYASGDAAGEDARMRWIAWWANLRSRLLRLPYGDQGIFCRRDAYERSGGFRDLPVCDDLDLVRRLRRTGRFVILPEVMRTSPRKYRAGALRQVLRVWRVAAGYFLGVSPERLSRWYSG